MADFVRRRTGRALTASVALLAGGTLAGCAGSKPPLPHGDLDTTGVLVARAPVPTASPNVFEVGLPSTQTLPSGQQVELTVGGPSLTNPVAGKPVQFARMVKDTFHLTAVNHGSTVVDFTPADFAVRIHPFQPKLLDPVSAPAKISIEPGATATWDVSTVEEPGEGQLVWRQGGKILGSWQFVVEND